MVYFEVHYWGKFQLLASPVKAGEWLQVAEKVTYGPPVFLLLSPTSGLFSLSTKPDFSIAESWDEFLDEEIQGESFEGSSIYFDKRKKLEELLSAGDYFTTEINDPEYFEEVEAYMEVIEICEKMSGGELHFQAKSGRHVSEYKKEIYLHTAEKQYFITLSKELFDNEIIHGLNRILEDRGTDNYRFSSTINGELKMVILKLTADKFRELEGMGLLI